MISTFKPTTIADIFEFEVINAISKQIEIVPVSDHLYQNYPNPFNPATIIGYRLSAVSNVELKVYNILGQEVITLVSERQKAGLHQVEWNGDDFSSGIYYYQIKAGDFYQVKKMVLIK
jgi:hypothetical protein